MRIILFPLFLLLILPAFAQFAVINDPDGYTNVRKEGSRNGKVIDRIQEEEVFWLEEWGAGKPVTKEEWKYVTYFRKVSTLSDAQKTALLSGEEGPDEWIQLEGYIHHSRVSRFESFQSFKQHIITDDFVVFSNGDHLLEVRIGQFRPGDHEVETHPPSDGNTITTVTAIDGKHFWGMDLGMPTREIQWITLSDGNRKYEIPSDGFSEFYQPSLNGMKAWLGPKGKIYLEMHNSDGAGAYSVAFVFEKGKLIHKNVGISF